LQNVTIVVLFFTTALVLLGSLNFASAGGPGGGGGGIVPCDKTWFGGEGNWEDPSKWTPSPPVSGMSEVICIDGGNIANSVVHLNSDFNVPLDIIVDSGDKVVVESGWTLSHGFENFSYHNNGMLQIFGSYVQLGSIFFNDGIVLVECGGSFDIFSGGLFEGRPLTIAHCLTAVGGEMFPVDTTALLLAATYSTASWMIPLMIAAVGFGILITHQKSKLKHNSCPSCKLVTEDFFELGDKVVSKCDNPKCRVNLFFIRRYRNSFN